MKNPYHAWLIRQRRYCEHRGCDMKLTKATEVVNRNGKDFVYCDWHAMGQIEAGLKLRHQIENHNDKIRNSPNAVS